MKAKLISTKGKLVRKEFPIDPRKGLAISLDKERIEIRFDPDDDKYLFEAAAIPVSVNGTRIEKKDLEDGDRISIGPNEFTFVLSDSEDGGQSAEPENKEKKPESIQEAGSSSYEGSDTEQLSKIEFCVRCGVPITEDDFSEAGARRIDGKVFCGGCAGDVLKPRSGKKPKKKKDSGSETSELTSEEIEKAKEIPDSPKNTRRRTPARRRTRRKPGTARKPGYQRARRSVSSSEKEKDHTDALKPVRAEKSPVRKAKRKKSSGRRAAVPSSSNKEKGHAEALKPVRAEKAPAGKAKRKKTSERLISAPAEKVREKRPEPQEKKPGILQKSMTGLGLFLKKTLLGLGRVLKKTFSALGRFMKKVSMAALKASGSLVKAASVLGLRFIVNAVHRVYCGIKIMRIKREIRSREHEIGRWAHKNSANSLAVSNDLLDILARIKKCRKDGTCGKKEIKSLFNEAGELLYEGYFGGQEDASGIAEGLKKIEDCELRIEELRKQHEPEKKKKKNTGKKPEKKGKKDAEENGEPFAEDTSDSE